MRQNPQISIVVQPSPFRCYRDEEYTAFGIPLQENLHDCDILMGVKEIPETLLIPEKNLFFLFTHHKTTGAQSKSNESPFKKAHSNGRL